MRLTKWNTYTHPRIYQQNNNKIKPITIGILLMIGKKKIKTKFERKAIANSFICSDQSNITNKSIELNRFHCQATIFFIIWN